MRPLEWLQLLGLVLLILALLPFWLLAWLLGGRQ